MNITCNSDFTSNRVLPDEVLRETLANEKLIDGVRQGTVWNDGMLGWFRVSGAASGENLRMIGETALYVRENADTLIVIGIGGSNRGAMAAIRALRHSIPSRTRVVFAGDSLSAAGLLEAIACVREQRVMVNVIAKDFNTLEPGITFRMIRAAMVEKYGNAYNERIIATGSYGPGQLYELAQRNGYRFIEFPVDIPGRFSVLSPVALFPMAVSGIDIGKLTAGAEEMEKTLKETGIGENSAVKYAVTRKLLQAKGFHIESLILFENELVPLARWWTQLCAETEGKSACAVFPTFFNYSEDLHAVGQYVQQGPRCIIETYVSLFHSHPELRISGSPDVKDGFDYLDGLAFDVLNRTVYSAALNAHYDDGIPCFEFSGSVIDERTLGEFFYFFMFATYLSASLLGVNPFNQEGVEKYKKNMYSLLGK